MTDIPDPTAPATVEQVLALVGDDTDDTDDTDERDERFDDLLLVLAGDKAEVTTTQGQTIAAIIETFTDDQITALCEAFDLCPHPLHRRDIQICADDEAPECRDYRLDRHLS